MISILIPTRGRIDNFIRFAESVFATSTGDVEILARFDDDDEATLQSIKAKLPDPRIHWFIGPRICMSDLWNELLEYAKGDILMLGGDDLVFRTPGWDVQVENYFAGLTDKIAYVFGDDLSPAGKKFGTHGIVHKRWIETVGYFTAPGYSADYADAWPNDVASMIGRLQYLPFVTEHMHPVWGKSDFDRTYKETNERLHRDNTPDKYKAELPLRQRDADKLRAVMGCPKWSLLILTLPSRTEFLRRLMDVLLPQITDHHDIEIVTRISDPDFDLGTNRQLLLNGARGQYVNFIDDDDLVTSDYVAKIYPLLDGVDYVGIGLQMYCDGQKQKPTFNSLKYTEWSSDDDGFYRDISHICPIKRELALKVPMEGGVGEDQRWASKLRALKVVKTEHCIEEPVYLYYFRSKKESIPQYAAPAPPAPRKFDTPVQKTGCPSCGNAAIGMAGGMRRCNQCGFAW